MIERKRYIGRLRPFFHKDIVKVLTGLRRSGKSVLLQQVMEALRADGADPAAMLYYNFEDLRNLPLYHAEALYADILAKLDGRTGGVCLFFDEIQEVDDWERVVNSLRVSHHADIYLTGSNAHLLSGELATLLAGRYVAFPVYPFSFAEYCAAYPEKSSEACWRSYLALGGMPFLTHLDDESAALQYLQDIYRSVVLKDIVERHTVRNIDLLARVVRYAAESIGHTFSAMSIAKYLKSEHRSVAPETIMNYLAACTESFLLYRIPRQDLAGKKILTVNEKYYLADHGLRTAIHGSAQNIDQTLENIVCMELLRRGYRVTVGKAGAQEIDFVCDRAKERIYVQVTYLLASEETIAREFGAYKTIRDNYPKYVVSMDPVDFSRNGILHKNIIDFLRMETY
ncbi:ATP-binding protein [uncultured Selenomonas sp.]|uniref:ATP-binding protein n=1 Tax=uncultured Selenomonas sp. TaxID=159275 RepID=UPI0025F1659D|nr:ATP-binding protein [uncultured Selenomonas sp.]